MKSFERGAIGGASIEIPGAGIEAQARFGLIAGHAYSLTAAVKTNTGAKACFQNYAFSSVSDWLDQKERSFYWLIVTCDLHQKKTFASSFAYAIHGDKLNGKVNGTMKTNVGMKLTKNFQIFFDRKKKTENSGWTLKISPHFSQKSNSAIYR